jgi:hypothetical protein
MKPSIARLRARRARMAAEAEDLDVAARCARDEDVRRHAAFDDALAEFDLARLTTETVLDLYLAGVGA